MYSSRGGKQTIVGRSPATWQWRQGFLPGGALLLAAPACTSSRTHNTVFILRVELVESFVPSCSPRHAPLGCVAQNTRAHGKMGSGSLNYAHPAVFLDHTPLCRCHVPLAKDVVASFDRNTEKNTSIVTYGASQMIVESVKVRRWANRQTPGGRRDTVGLHLVRYGDENTFRRV